MPFVSISLDVVGSTEIKKQFSDFSSKHDTSLDEHYADILKSMLVSMTLFLKLVQQDKTLDISRLYLVKRIGDEYWYTYDIDNLDAGARTRHLTHLLKVVLSFLTEAPFDVTAFLPDAHVRRELCWKCTLDLVNHAVDASRLTEDELDQFLLSLKNKKKIPGINPDWDPESLTLRNNLGVGYSYPQREQVLYMARSDYLGLEIDRFFRISRSAKKGKVLAGKNFMSSLLMYTSPVTGKSSFRIPTPGDTFMTSISEISVEPLEFSETELKGIKGGYSGAHIFNDFFEKSDSEEYWESMNKGRVYS